MDKLINKSITAAVITTAVISSPLLLADNHAQNQSGSQSGVTTQQQMPWLGVTLGQVPSVLSAQLSAIIPSGQGVLVLSVSPDSPAEKAGIKENDVLLSMDDQRLYSAGQLSGLIKASKPGSQINFKAVKGGKLVDIEVSVGQRAAKLFQHNAFGNNKQWNAPSWLAPQTAPLTPKQNAPLSQNKMIGNFESIQVRSLPDDRYKAEVTYKNKADETKQFTFEGKREEIIEQVKKQKDLPDDKKQSLLNALDMNWGTMGMPKLFNSPIFNHPFFTQPFGNRFPGGFNDPFFQNNPFDDPFFRGFPNFRPPSMPRNYQQTPQATPQPQSDKHNDSRGSLI